MGSVQFFRRLFDYDHWANRAALESVKAAAATGERAQEYFRHIIGAERIWLARFTDPAPPKLTPWPSLTLDECAAEVENLHAEWLALLDNMSPQGLGSSLTYRNMKGVEFTTSITDVLTHLVMHSAYHRGQVAKAVRDTGGKPAATDYVVWVRQRADPGELKS